MPCGAWNLLDENKAAFFFFFVKHWVSELIAFGFVCQKLRVCKFSEQFLVWQQQPQRKEVGGLLAGSSEVSSQSLCGKDWPKMRSMRIHHPAEALVLF